MGRFVNRCLIQTSEFDDLFKDSNVMNTYVDVCLPRLDGMQPFNHLLNRRPGIVFKYYLSLLDTMLGGRWMSSSGWKIFEEFTYQFAFEHKDDPNFNPKLWEKIEKIHRDIVSMTMMCD